MPLEDQAEVHHKTVRTSTPVSAAFGRPSAIPTWARFPVCPIAGLAAFCHTTDATGTKLLSFPLDDRHYVARSTLAAWNIERANRLEAGLAADGIDPLLSDANEKTLNRIATYRMRAERTFHKCLKELQSYQAAHPLDEPMLKNEAKVETKNEPKLLEFAFKREPVRPEPKIGRNELCPCHSGRKYKNCCLRNEPKSAIPAIP